MAEFVNPLGKIRGKVGNIIVYVTKEGKNCCKSSPLERKPGGEGQKRQNAAIAAIAKRKRWLMKVIRVGFPGGKGYAKGFSGFISANVRSAVSVERIHPEQEEHTCKKALQEFKGTVDYGKLRVAAGRLATPDVSAEVCPERRKIIFTSPGTPLESVHCFADDKIYGVVIDPSKRKCHFQELGVRGISFCTEADFPPEASPEHLAAYAFATSADGKDASDSVCLLK